MNEITSFEMLEIAAKILWQIFFRIKEEGEGKFSNSLGTSKIERYYTEVLFEQLHPLHFPPTIKGSEVMHTAYIRATTEPEPIQVNDKKANNLKNQD